MTLFFRTLGLLFFTVTLSGECLIASDWAPFQTLLDRVITPHHFQAIHGRFSHNSVDYAKMWTQKAQFATLMKQQKQILAKAVAPQTKNKQLAFWINAYNFFTLAELFDHPNSKSMKDIGWKAEKWQVGKKKVSLDWIEHKLLRSLKDPRIHFAINCASVSCPSLATRVFTVKAIDSELNTVVENGLRNPLHLYAGKSSGWFSSNKKALVATQLFNWFGDDFKVSPYKSIAGFIHHFAPYHKALEKVDTAIDYDWKLNNSQSINACFDKLIKALPNQKIVRAPK